jgi:hypothetical protein
MGDCLDACIGSKPRLTTSLRKGNVEAVRALLADSENKVPLTFGTPGTLLHLAAQGGSVPVLELVWQHLKDTWEERAEIGQQLSTPSQRISGYQAHAQEGTLHEYLNLPNAKGVSALMEAIRGGHSAAATFLLNQVRALPAMQGDRRIAACALYSPQIALHAHVHTCARANVCEWCSYTAR